MTLEGSGTGTGWTGGPVTVEGEPGGWPGRRLVVGSHCTHTHGAWSTIFLPPPVPSHAMLHALHCLLCLYTPCHTCCSTSSSLLAFAAGTNCCAKHGFSGFRLMSQPVTVLSPCSAPCFSLDSWVGFGAMPVPRHGTPTFSHSLLISSLSSLTSCAICALAEEREEEGEASFAEPSLPLPSLSKIFKLSSLFIFTFTQLPKAGLWAKIM